jgi:hypothetical protein
MEESKIEQIPSSQEVIKQESEPVSVEVDKESIPSPENSLEKPVEKKEEKKIIAEIEKEGGLAAQSSTASVLKRREEEIDKILSEGLNDIFLKMSPQKQKEFQEKGEETVKKISILLGETKVKVSKIIDLIKKWLKLIPGVNKFFLEQETKLKVDKIMKIKKNL